MKRYVTEMANDLLMRDTVSAKKKEYIRSILRICQNGLITDLDAVVEIVKVVRDV